MSKPEELVEKGFVVMGRSEKDGIVRMRQLSRRYHLREAAEEYAKIIRQNVPDAYVRVVVGRERQ